MKRGLVISDLHLFARRSVGDRLLEGMRPDLARAELLVLNGDTFDFGWSQLPSEEASIAAAMQWLHDLAEEFEGGEIHYILGNHDCLHSFRNALDELVRTMPGVSSHEHQLRLGRHLFLHGDCANRKMDGADLARLREAWSRKKARTRAHAALYGIIDALGISRGFHRCYFPARTSIKRVAHYLDHVMPGWREDVDDCYFGHTHQPFRAHAFDGVRFHNSGSGIRGMDFQPVHFDLNPGGN